MGECFRWSPECCPQLTNRNLAARGLPGDVSARCSGLALLRAFASSKPSLSAARSPPCCSTHTAWLGANRSLTGAGQWFRQKTVLTSKVCASSHRRGIPSNGSNSTKVHTAQGCRTSSSPRFHSREPRGWAMGVQLK